MLFFLSSIKYHWNIPMYVTSNLNELGKIGTLYLSNFLLPYSCCHCPLKFLSSQCSNRIANLIFGSFLEALVTLMYISYSHLLSISLHVLTPACIHCNSIDSSVKLLVLFVDGMFFMDILKLFTSICLCIRVKFWVWICISI